MPTRSRRPPPSRCTNTLYLPIAVGELAEQRPGDQRHRAGDSCRSSGASRSGIPRLLTVKVLPNGISMKPPVASIIVARNVRR